MGSTLGTVTPVVAPAWKFDWSPLYSGNGKIKIFSGSTSATVVVEALAKSSSEQDVILNLVLTRVSDGFKIPIRGTQSPYKLTVIVPQKGRCQVYMNTQKVWRTAPIKDSKGNNTYGFYRRWDFVPSDQFNHNITQSIWWEESWHWIHNQGNTRSGYSSPIQGSTQDTWGTSDGWGYWTQDLNAPFHETHSGRQCTYYPIIGKLPNDWTSTGALLLKGVQNITWAAWDIHKNTLSMFDNTPYIDGAIDPTNKAPIISILTAVTPTQIEATIVDDGLPDPPFDVALSWKKVNGPGAVTFNPASISHSPRYWDSNKSVTTVSYSTPGIYTLELTASDSTLKATKTITVTVP